VTAAGAVGLGVGATAPVVLGGAAVVGGVVGPDSTGREPVEQPAASNAERTAAPAAAFRIAPACHAPGTARGRARAAQS
jgi:hypothetical protein